MKHRKTAQSSTLFLMELIIAILFFAIAAAVCVRIFATSHTMSNDARATDFAVNECSGIAEAIETGDNTDAILDTLAAEYPLADTRNENGTIQFIIYYDDSFETVSSKDAVAAIMTTLTEEGTMIRGDITAYHTDADAADAAPSDESDIIYTLHADHHMQQEIKS